MSYRGDDLDLRTPQGAAADIAPSHAPEFAPQPSRRSPAARSAPIWVDDTTLECCNHAYDVASAHRAPEVRLEHLIYALTRIDEAAEALEVRGVRVAALRREAATAIATEIPASPGNGRTNPRRAEAFEEVLRIAAAHAYRRQAPVAPADVVYALLDAGFEFPSLVRLLPAPARPAVAPAEPALDVELIRERVRNGGQSAKPSGRGLTDLASLASAQAGLQATRIDAVEHSIRTLTTELANERKILSGVLQDLQRELMAQREDTSRLSGITPDKIQAIFGDRLQSLEQAFLSSRSSGGDLGSLQERLGLLERALQAEISVTRAAVEALAEKPAVDVGPVLERIDGVEASIAAERERATTGEQSLASAIQAIAAAIESQHTELVTRVSGPLNERLDTLVGGQATSHAALAEGLAEAQRRLAALEDALSAHVTSAGETASAVAAEQSALGGRIELLATALDNAAETSRTSYARLTETLTQDLTDLHDGISKTESGQQTLAAALDTQAEDLEKAFAVIVSRIEGLEKAAEKPVEMLLSLTQTVEKMHKLTVERYYKRNRFWYWLFGTDDWLAASWPSQSARIEEELRQIKN
jgi:hypothetical protein